MTSSSAAILSSAALVAAVLAVYASDYAARASPAPMMSAGPVVGEGGDDVDVRSALEYLQKLDKYYSQAARPR